MFSPILAVMLIGQVLAQEIVGVEEHSDCIQNPCVPPESYSDFIDYYDKPQIECACRPERPNCKSEEELACIKNPCMPPQIFSGFDDYGRIFDINCACPSPYHGPTCTYVRVQVATASEVEVSTIGSSSGSRKGPMLAYCCKDQKVVVNDVLVIRAKKESQYSPVRYSAIGFSVRVNGTFLEGKDMKCVNDAIGSALGDFLYSEDFEFDDQWDNPSVTVNNQGSELRFYDIDDWHYTGDYAVAPDDALLWLGNQSIIYCRINLTDLQDNLPSIGPEPEYPEYLGCWRDDADRVMEKSTLQLSPMQTKSNCVEWCIELDYEFAGTQNSKECFCGDDYTRLGQADNCIQKCTGNDEMCGGGWALSVYRTGVTKSNHKGQQTQVTG